MLDASQIAAAINLRVLRLEAQGITGIGRELGGGALTTPAQSLLSGSWCRPPYFQITYFAGGVGSPNEC